MIKRTTLVIVLTMIITFIVNAEETRIILDAGVGAMYNGAVYKGEKGRVDILPLINARYGRFSLEYDRAKIYVTDDLALTAGMGNMGYDDVEGMDKRLMTITAGADYRMKIVGDISAKIKVDGNFFGSKNGFSCDLAIEKETAISENDFLSIHAGGKYIDKNITDYYYGVKTNEVKTGREVYKPEGTVMPEIGLDYIRIITPNIYMLVSASGEAYLKEITDSPIVDAKGSFNTITGICYKFK